MLNQNENDTRNCKLACPYWCWFIYVKICDKEKWWINAYRLLGHLDVILYHERRIIQCLVIQGNSTWKYNGSREWIWKQNIQARIMIIEEYGFSMCDSMFSTSKPNLVYFFTSSSHLEGLMCFSHTPNWTKSLLSSPQALSCGCVISENQLSGVERLRCCERERAIQI